MPVYLHIFNLIIDKQSVIEKYSGGVEQFRIDYDIPLSEINQEDDELFSLGGMDVDQFDIDRLVSSGLSFDIEKQISNDFTIIYRYGDIYWEVNWLKNNSVFAWHIDVNSDLKLKMDEISNMSMGYINQQIEKGNNLFRTIRLEN
jgi:hypothetical protein